MWYCEKTLLVVLSVLWFCFYHSIFIVCITVGSRVLAAPATLIFGVFLFFSLCSMFTNLVPVKFQFWRAFPSAPLSASPISGWRDNMHETKLFDKGTTNSIRIHILFIFL